jgi:glucan phosphoethanolaminetransferase (alkaline phosphatase superfamily)
VLFVKIVYESYFSYYKDIENFKNMFSEISNSPKTNATKINQGELHVVILDETESREFIHAFNGPVENSPFRDSLDSIPGWIKFHMVIAIILIQSE